MEVVAAAEVALASLRYSLDNLLEDPPLMGA